MSDGSGRPLVYMDIGTSSPKEVFSNVKKFVNWRMLELDESISCCDWESANSVVFLQDFNDVKTRDLGSQGKKCLKEGEKSSAMIVSSNQCCFRPSPTDS